MYLLGINAYHPDSSACLLKDGVVVAASEEERFTRVKHWAGLPSLATKFCLDEAGIDIGSVDHIAIGRDPRAKFVEKVIYQFRQFRGWSGAWERLMNSRHVGSIAHQIAEALGEEETGLNAAIHNVEHHRSHLASAFYPSPFEKAALVSIDGSGDFTTTMVGMGEGNRIAVLDSVSAPVSIGTFYTAFTQYLGFPHYGDEYKVMGLAPYGEPRYLKQMRRIIFPAPNGLFRRDSSYFRSTGDGALMRLENNLPIIPTMYSQRVVEVFGPPRKPDETLEQRHKDIAASVQCIAEEIIFHILRSLHQRTGLRSVCIAGGVAQNSVANGKITDSTGFEQVYIPSAGHDAGTAIGAPLHVWCGTLGNPRPTHVRSAYTGAHFTNEYIEKLLVQKGIPYVRVDSEQRLLEQVVDRIASPGVVGWFHGRAEFGPRALGARSILADPRNAAAKDLLNAKIKRRESFRPFAPSILSERVGEFFAKVDEVPFMEKVFTIKPERRAAIPAVTHVDGTGRLQTVHREISPRYYRLIEVFGMKTGIPVLLNTSFNENEPIVNRPEEALDCYLRTDMDMLVLEDCVVERHRE